MTAGESCHFTDTWPLRNIRSGSRAAQAFPKAGAGAEGGGAAAEREGAKRRRAALRLLGELLAAGVVSSATPLLTVLKDLVRAFAWVRACVRACVRGWGHGVSAWKCISADVRAGGLEGWRAGSWGAPAGCG